MNVKSVEKSDKSTATLVLEIESSQFQAALDKVYRQVKNDIYIPGFRKGKAPRKIVERMYGSNIFHEDAINMIFPDIWNEVTETQNLNTVGTPSITDLNVDETGALELTVESGLYPEVTLGQYLGVAAEKMPAEVSEDEVDAEIQKLAERNSTIETVERPAEMGDTVIIDYDGYMDGEPFEGGSGDNHSLKLGSGTFIPGFEEQLVGASAGEDREVQVTFPEDYGAEQLAGKPAVFQVKVKEVKTTHAPELDDEFAKDVSETADTLEDLRNEQREKLLKQKEDESNSAFRNAAVQAAVENMTTVIPDAMIEEELDNTMWQISSNMQQSGFTMEQYAQIMGTDVQTMRESYRSGATEQIRMQLMLEAVADAENIEVTDEQVEEAYQKMADENGMELEQVKEAVDQENLRIQERLQKAIDLIVEHAVVKEPQTGEADAPAEAEAEAETEPAAEADSAEE